MAESLLSFVRRFEKQTDHSVTSVHIDGGTEFSRALDYLDKYGMDVTIKMPYCPKSNGLAEISHAVLTNLTRACL